MCEFGSGHAKRMRALKAEQHALRRSLRVALLTMRALTQTSCCRLPVHSTNGCHLDPPQDVAHVQFRSRIACKCLHMIRTRTLEAMSDSRAVVPSKLFARHVACDASVPSGRIAWSAVKLVWATPSFNTFVLVDDDGALLNSGRPTGSLPHPQERAMNYQLVRGSKYAVEADKIGKSM